MAIPDQAHHYENSDPLTTRSRSHEAAAARKSQNPLADRSGQNLSSTNSHESTKAQFKVPVGDGPYVRAKQIQLVEKDPERAIALFWAAINSGDRVDSALKDMAVVMKQQNRGEEAIQAILSFRHLCSPLAQESLDNVLLDLYKKCGRLDDQINLLKHKLGLIHKGMVFNGKRTKTARSQGRKFQISIRQEATRLLGNLGWAYMQLHNYPAAEAVYRKALSIEEDSNKLCNLGVCLLEQDKQEEARAVLERVTPMSPDGRLNSESHVKSYQRSQALLHELSTRSQKRPSSLIAPNPDNQQHPQEFDLWTHWKPWEAPMISSNSSSQNLSNSSTIGNASSQLNEPLSMRVASTCDDVDTSLTLGGGRMTSAKSPPSKPDSASFKREIGPPSSNLHQSNRAKKNPHEHNKNDFGLGEDYYAMKVGATYCSSPNRDWVVSSSFSLEPVARRLFHKSINRTKHRIDDADDYDGDLWKSVSQVVQMDAQSLPQGEHQTRGATNRMSELDFSCVDKVIESVVADDDMPPASDTEANLSMRADAAANLDCIAENEGNAGAMEKMIQTSKYNKGDLISKRDIAAAWPETPVALQSLTGLQHRLRVFQDMTHDAALMHV